MEKDLNDSAVHNSYLKESDNDKSFVGKVKSIISNTPLSKWFRKQDDNRPVIRRRDEVFEDEEDISEIQPPSKRAKLPVTDGVNNSICNNVLFPETRISSTNSVSNNIFNKIPEPVAGPSGLKSHKLVSGTSTATARSTFISNDLLNGHSDSEESTSGYSSVARIGSKEQVCGSQESSKQTSPTQTSPSNSRSLFRKSNVGSNRSLFAERSLSPNMNTSLSSRRPNFNASTFGSPNFVDKTISTKRIINSPFYNGKTIYGGASAYGRSLGRSSQDLKTSLRNSVQIKPTNKSENGNVVLGKTARRILDTIEQYSSPVNDAKKIPVVSGKSRRDGLLTRYTGANPYIVRGPSNKELQVPTIPELLKMKTRLQESTESVRQLAASSKSDLNTEYYKIPTREEEKEKHTGKMKNKVTSVRPKVPSNEVVNEVKLTPVSLPITVLPKFDFVIPPPVPVKNKPTPPKTTQIETTVHTEKRTSTTAVTEYTFSDPLVVAENMKSIVAINDFKFSEPRTCTKNKPEPPKTATLNFKMPENKPPGLIPKKAREPAKTLKSGSVMDVLGKKDSLMEKFKPAQGTWECAACMIRNQPDRTRCAACETPKTGATDNKSEIKLSVPKPVTVPEKMTVSSGFGDKFKPSTDTWECGVCMIRNKRELTKCAACETPNPAAKKPEPTNGMTDRLPSFGDAFKAKTDEWECGTCMVRNKESNAKCQCCETPNPKATPSNGPALGLLNDKKPIATFNFGIDKAAATSFNFGIPSTVEAPKTDAKVGSIFGGATKPAPEASVSFSFGVPPPAQEKPKITEAEPPKPNPPVLPEEKQPAKTEKMPTEFKFTAVEKETKIVKPDAPKPPVDPKPVFNFKPTTTKTNGEVPNSLFGNKPTAIITTAPATVTSSATFSFGSKPAAIAAPTPTTQPSQPEPPKNLFKFGPATENPTPAPSLNNGFGRTNASFEKPAANPTETKTFAKDSSEPPSKVPMFSFSATPTAANPPAKSSGFSFGSNSTMPSFNFTPGKTDSPAFSAAPSTNVFGSAANAGAQNGAFNFGSMATSNNSQKAGFSFGAPVTSSTGSGFNFGASTTTFTPSSGGFNFSGAPPAFNAAAKPSFNFTDGSMAAFSAQQPTDGGVAAPRKIKRAVRRTQR